MEQLIFTHYGPNYNYIPVTNDINQWKIKTEKEFSTYLLNPNSYQMKLKYEENPNLLCGPYSVYTLLKLLELRNNNITGKIACYYDSTKIEKSLQLICNNNLTYNKNQEQHYNQKSNFVSYMSIIWK